MLNNIKYFQPEFNQGWDMEKREYAPVSIGVLQTKAKAKGGQVGHEYAVWFHQCNVARTLKLDENESWLEGKWCISQNFDKGVGKHGSSTEVDVL